MNQAEQHRSRYAHTEHRQGYTLETIAAAPVQARRHPDSDHAAHGWIFPDGSQLWEIQHGPERAVYAIQGAEPTPAH